MVEEFLHYIWKYKLFSNTYLSTDTGEPIHIERSGIHNTDEGPDFHDARIRIGETLWAGNIEIHLRSSDWWRHKHQHNKAYQNIILHVVYENDTPLFFQNGEKIPTLSLKGNINTDIYKRYISLRENKNHIPCGSQFTSVEPFLIQLWLERLLIERLEQKTSEIKNILNISQNNWEETFYIHLAKSFGFKTNSVPFEMLAKSIPMQTLAKQKDNLFQLEALLFGQSGLLEKQFQDKYPRELQNEFVFLAKKYKLSPIEAHLWKFMRMRPMNFPTIRIAQFASLANKSSHLLSKILDAKNTQEIKSLFSTEVSKYWTTHYNFDKESAYSQKSLGEPALENLLINTIVPFLFVYGRLNGEEKFVTRSYSILEELKAEKNSVLKAWEAIGFRADSAARSQALIQLRNYYCSHKKCLQCAIGNKLLSSSTQSV